MNTPDVTPEQPTAQQASTAQQPADQSPERPLGYWLRTVDHSIKRSMRDALTEDGLGRRAWRTLSVIESGATSVDEIDAALPERRRGPRGPKGFGRPNVDAGQGLGHDTGHDTGHDRGFGHDGAADGELRFDPRFGPRFGRGRGFGGAPFGPGHRGPHGRRRSTEELVMDFAAHGWVTIGADGITLTDAGREAHAALRTKVQAVRQTVADAVSPEDLATTLASLESIARAFGWDERTAQEHGPRGRFGRGPRGHRDEFGHRDGFGHRGHRRGTAERCGHDGHGDVRDDAEASAGSPTTEAR